MFFHITSPSSHLQLCIILLCAFLCTRINLMRFNHLDIEQWLRILNLQLCLNMISFLHAQYNMFVTSTKIQIQLSFIAFYHNFNNGTAVQCISIFDHFCLLKDNFCLVYDDVNHFSHLRCMSSLIS